MPTVYTFITRAVNLFLDRSKPSSSKSKIAVYFDHGVSASSAMSFVMNCYPLIKSSSYSLCLMDSEALKTKAWEQETALLVFPGGRARPYYKSLGAELKPEKALPGERRSLREIGTGNHRIKNFVLEGGSYLGLCAGAYYGAEETVFAKGEALEVLDEGALNFFPGTAEGPVYGNASFSYHTKKGARLAKVSWLDKSADKQIGYAYYNGGCLFRMPKARSKVTVLGRYEDLERRPAAMVLCQVGAGRALLSGIHPEISYQFSPLRFLLHPKLLGLFLQNYKFQKAVLESMLTILLKKAEVYVADPEEPCVKKLR